MRPATLKKLWAALVASDRAVQLIDFVVGSKQPTLWSNYNYIIFPLDFPLKASIAVFFKKQQRFISMDALQYLSNIELRERWKQCFGTKLHSHASPEFLLGHLIWDAQAKQHGGLSRKAKSQLKKLMQQLREGKDLVPDNTLIIKPGTKLLREYKGKKYEVIKTKTGFLYQGKNYGSLSIIARDITGTRWNGKLFFGIKK